MRAHSIFRATLFTIPCFRNALVIALGIISFTGHAAKDCFNENNGPRTEYLVVKFALPGDEPKWQKLEIKFSCNEDATEEAEVVNIPDFGPTFGSLALVNGTTYTSGYLNDPKSEVLNPSLAVDVETSVPHRRYRLHFRWREAKNAIADQRSASYIPFFQYSYLSFRGTYQIYSWDKGDEMYRLETKKELPLLIEAKESSASVRGKPVKVLPGISLPKSATALEICGAIRAMNADFLKNFPSKSNMVTDDFAGCATPEMLMCEKISQSGKYQSLLCRAKFLKTKNEENPVTLDLLRVDEKNSIEFYHVHATGPAATLVPAIKTPTDPFLKRRPFNDNNDDDF